MGRKKRMKRDVLGPEATIKSMESAGWEFLGSFSQKKANEEARKQVKTAKYEAKIEEEHLVFRRKLPWVK